MGSTKHPFYQIKKYYKIIKDKNNLKNKIIQCNLCPHNCIIQNNKTGLCKTRKNINGKFYSLVYGLPCSVHIDPIEKKPLYHFMPGKAVLSIGTFGCNLFCKGCQNYKISRADAETLRTNLKYYSPREIITIMKKQNIKMIAFTYNEPFIFFEYMLNIAKLAKKEKIKTVIVSNGYVNSAPLKELCKYIDGANIDIKGIIKSTYKEYSKADIAPILNNIKIIKKSGVWIELTNLIIPTINDNPADIKKLCVWIKKELGADIPLHFSRFFPQYEISHLPATSPKVLDEAKNIAKSAGLNYIYTGNTLQQENTHCKKCKTILIKRPNYTGEIVGLRGKQNNKCIKCKTLLQGVFKF